MRHTPTRIYLGPATAGGCLITLADKVTGPWTGDMILLHTSHSIQQGQGTGTQPIGAAGPCHEQVPHTCEAKTPGLGTVHAPDLEHMLRCWASPKHPRQTTAKFMPCATRARQATFLTRAPSSACGKRFWVGITSGICGHRFFVLDRATTTGQDSRS